MALYPPVVASSMPAFDINQGKVKIYYTLSMYNTAKQDKISKVQVSVRRQSSNVNVLVDQKEIIVKDFGLQDDLDKLLNRYYIEIEDSEIKKDSDGNTGFEEDVLYKVQLRFCSGQLSGNENFYTANVSYLSEWSTVCIIKPIQVPQFYIQDFYVKGQQPKESDTNYFYSTLCDWIGVYKQEKSSQILKQWRLRLLSNEYTQDSISKIDDYILSDSGWVVNSANNYNTIDESVVLSCSLPYELENNANYKLLFEIQTRNGYTKSLLYPFVCSNQNINQLDGNIKTYFNEEEGYFKIVFTSGQDYFGNMVLRRTDSRSNFHKWEDLMYYESYDNPSFTYYDFTAQSGMFYRYLIQKIDARGRRGTPVYDQSKTDNIGILAEWEHPFLLESTGNGKISGTKQLKLKYDFQISSYKTNIAESKTDTIGSKYPFIRRNGNMYYRSFPVTGTITGFMDQASLFTNKQELFNNKYSQYKQFKGQLWQHGTQYDYTYERKFREKVEQFLYNSKPKLYKSMQQGNIFIKLMEVSLTPKNELGRLVYSFSATAYEIDKAELSTYNNYGLIHTGQFNPNVSKSETVLAQLNEFGKQIQTTSLLFKGGEDIIGALPGIPAAANSIAKHIKYNESFNSKKVTDFNINWFRLTFESEPYLILELGENNYRPFDDVIPEYTTDSYVDKNIVRNDIIQSIRNNNYQDDVDKDIKYKLYQMESTYGTEEISTNDTNVYLGWLFYLNNKPIIVSYPNNIYQVKDDAFILKKESTLIPAKDTSMIVDFRLINIIAQDVSLLPKNIRIKFVNGQFIGSFTEKDQFISKIYYKYKYNYLTDETKDKIKRYVNEVQSVLVDTEPRTVIKLMTQVMQSDDRFVVNDTGELNFDTNDSTISIKSLRIIGRNFDLSDFTQKNPVASLSDIISPRHMDLYRITNSDKVYAYYNSNFYKAEIRQDSTVDLYCPVDALVFYFASIREDTF